MRSLPGSLCVALIACAAIGIACGGSSHGSATPTPTPTASSNPTPAPCTAARSDRIRVLDETGQLWSFDPTAIGTTSSAFASIGTLACAPGHALSPFSDPAAPYSMSIDDLDRAWVLYTSGEIFLVSTTSASCSSTPFVPQQMTGGFTWSVFNQAFSTDSASAPGERMWIAGGSTDGSLGHLGSVSPSLAITDIGALAGGNLLAPQLMGLSDATLWGFFPSATGGYVQQIDKNNAALLGNPTAVDTTHPLRDFAAAQWGGKFYLFLTTTDAMGTTNNATVVTVDRVTGTVSTVLQNLPQLTVAAASSTCAPTTVAFAPRGMAAPPSSAGRNR